MIDEELRSTTVVFSLKNAILDGFPSQDAMKVVLTGFCRSFYLCNLQEMIERYAVVRPLRIGMEVSHCVLVRGVVQQYSGCT
jgi:hypothetical protein